MRLQHVLEVDQFGRTEIDEILALASTMRNTARDGSEQRMRGKILATLFYEPSTRTRLSFESAMLRLGGQIISSEMAAETSSAAKGETIQDTVRIVESYSDAIAIRHPEAGSSAAAASVASVPILNAGDGAREHPTQALLDLFTINDEIGRVDDFSIALVGDLRYGRAPRSLAKLLTKVRGCKIVMVTPPGIEMAEDVLNALRSSEVSFEAQTDLGEVIDSVDVVYMTRVQKERFPSATDYAAVQGRYQLDRQLLDRMHPDAVIMHPLPRVGEIHPQVDNDPRAAYFRQARNGVFIRMALLDMLLHG